jgi:glutathione S-transferase
MSESKIIFYDLASTKPNFPWSANTWKTRFTLNYKGLPYRTEWVEFPEIESKCKEMGIAPTATKPDGSPQYTVPAIWDPSTKTGLAESYHIAEYLDKTYPDTPRVLFDGMEEYTQVLAGPAGLPELRNLVLFVVPFLLPLLNPVSQEYYVRKLEGLIGKKWEDILPTGKAREEAWAQVKKGFDIVDALLQKNGGPYARGEQISFVDFSLGGMLYAFKLIWGEDNEFWKDVLLWNDGRWGNFVEKIEKYKEFAGEQ